jgi:urocanate hydratase
VRTLTDLRDDETLLVQSGRPVGVMTTHEWAPRVLIANSNLVGTGPPGTSSAGSSRLGLTMYGQMTAGSWIYIGTQGILQGTYETFAAVAEKRFGGTLAGTLTLTAGLGGMGGAQPLAVTMNGGVALVVECDPSRIDGAASTATSTSPPTTSTTRCSSPRRRRPPRPLSVGVLGNAADVVPELLRRGVEVDVVTDQTSAHDPLAYLPLGIAFEDWHAERERDPAGFTERAQASMATHVEAMVGFLDAGAEVFDYGNSLRSEAQAAGSSRAFDYPGFVPAYIRPLFCEGKGPFRWVALSGDPADIARPTGRARAVPRQRAPRPLDPAGRREGRLPGAAEPDLLARVRRAARGRARVQRPRRPRRRQRADRDRSRPPRLRARSPPRTARPRGCSTAPTRSPTGRC